MTRSRDGFAAALDAARSADVVLLFVGEEAALSGEAHSRAFLNLPGAQEDLAVEVAKAQKPVIAIIMAGRPLTFHDLASRVSASPLRLASRNDGRTGHRRCALRQCWFPPASCRSHSRAR